MTEESDGPKDLLGDPYKPLPDRRGRKKLRFAPDVYEKVEILRAADMSLEDIAANLNISEPSLKKYFLRELQSAHARVKGDLLAKLHEKALAEGSIPAIRLALQLLESGQAAVPVAGRRRAGAEVKPERLGKKAELERQAQDGEKGTGWAGLLN